MGKKECSNTNYMEKLLICRWKEKVICLLALTNIITVILAFYFFLEILK